MPLNLWEVSARAIENDKRRNKRFLKTRKYDPQYSFVISRSKLRELGLLHK